MSISRSASCSVCSSRSREFGGRRRAHQRHLDPRAHPGQGRAQVVRDVLGHLAHADQQALDPLQHQVQVLRQLVELVAVALGRDALAEVAGHDPRRRAVDPLQPAQHPAAHDQAAAQPEHHHHAQPEQDRGAHQAQGLHVVLHVAADQQSWPPSSSVTIFAVAEMRLGQPPADPRRPAPRTRRSRRRPCAPRPAVEVAGEETAHGDRPGGRWRGGSARPRRARRRAERSPQSPAPRYCSRSQPTSSSMVSRAWRSMNRMLAM